MLSFQFVESKNLQWLIRLHKELRIFFRSGLKNLAFNSFKKNLQWFTRIHNCLIHFYNFNLRFLSCSIHSQNKELGIIFPSELICFKQVFISFPNKAFWKKTCREFKLRLLPYALHSKMQKYFSLRFSFHFVCESSLLEKNCKE